jgi:ubiquinone/menaquinone biosynthesis C-methylase UbiE
MTTDLQPDQIALEWDNHVNLYEEVFEPFSLALADPAFRKLGKGKGRALLDVAAGPGGAALKLTNAGFDVTAIDASAEMVARIGERARNAAVTVDARTMEATALGFPDNSFDAAISVFGIVLVPDAASALGEMRRVVRPGGTVVVVTWTEPQNYELAAILNAAIDEAWPDRPRGILPAQLRYREQPDFEQLFADADLPKPVVDRQEAFLVAPNAQWLAQRIAFAPGMASMIAGLGKQQEKSLSNFISKLETKFGSGEVRLSGVAFTGMCRRP